MLTPTTILEALIVSGTLVCVTYFLMRVTAHCVLWLIELSFRPSEDTQRHLNLTPVRMLPKTNSLRQMKLWSRAMRDAIQLKP